MKHARAIEVMLLMIFYPWQNCQPYQNYFYPWQNYFYKILMTQFFWVVTNLLIWQNSLSHWQHFLPKFGASSKMEGEDLEGLIRYYFVRGFLYVEIIHFLSKYHGKVISERTLHRRLLPCSLPIVGGFFNVLQTYACTEGLWDRAYGLSSLSEKACKSNHFQMSTLSP